MRPGDTRAFSTFALKVRALVGMFQSLGQSQVKSELSCASRVQQLLSKLPTEHVTNFDPSEYYEHNKLSPDRFLCMVNTRMEPVMIMLYHNPSTPQYRRIENGALNTHVYSV